MTPRKPAHDLEAVKDAVEAESILISPNVLRDASLVLCDAEDMKACVLALSDKEFYKSMPSEKRPGRFQLPSWSGAAPLVQAG